MLARRHDDARRVEVHRNDGHGGPVQGRLDVAAEASHGPGDLVQRVLRGEVRHDHEQSRPGQVQVGDELGLAPERLRDLAVGGLLHDIGKLGIPDDLLRKPGALTDDEFSEVKRHVHSGDALLRELGGFSPMVHRLVRSHHERLDGSGYPDAVRGEHLPLDVRILAVCDVYDALISDRVYRDAWSHERAIAYLDERAERVFDRRCVQALERVLAAEQPYELAAAV